MNPGDSIRARFNQLDALRGLAALSVFAFHAFSMFSRWPRVVTALSYTPLNILWDGQASVVLFFVLSGFVLNLRYSGRSEYETGWWVDFLVRRALRIYPAFLTAIAIALVLRALGPPTDPHLSPWFINLWRAPLGIENLVRTLSLVGPGINQDILDPPIWSLVVEMRISLVFPIVILVVNRAATPYSEMFIFGMVVIASLLCAKFGNSGVVETNLLITAAHLPAFFLGAILARHIHVTLSWIAGLATRTKLLGAALSIMLFETSASLSHFGHFGLVAVFSVQVFSAFGAAGLIAICCSSERVETLLEHRIFQFVGRTSYSFYLLHMVLLLAIARYIRAPLVLWLSALFVSYALSALIYRWVEAPCNRFGKLVGASAQRVFRAI